MVKSSLLRGIGTCFGWNKNGEANSLHRVAAQREPRWINRDREAGHDRLFQDYFADEPVYNANIFRWRFRMRRDVFLRIVDALSNVYPYFQQGVDATGRRGLSPLQKCTAAIRMLAYGVASSDLWIWHAFFRVSGSNNDINVLDRSPVFDDILNDRALEVNYTINGNNYTMGYYLADGIYPEWATFVKSISKPQGEKRKLFAQYQEGQRKDVERAFRVLQARFAIIHGPARFWEKKKFANIMKACIILHNMIVRMKETVIQEILLKA
ncbi:uncharacterized protein LOC107490739 [Arachis duranensis]|uniref:Uncharacterized protein LOC107490739 n=1 Tax=Arachis duranensis TaxID=130453 RepID=A0A6P4DJC2_ARADU|nr:uncharacterized protein LOC107490739 [Arachis duranensis]